MKANRLSTALAACAFLGASYGATPKFTSQTAPDAVSRSILAARYTTFQDGASGPGDVRAAIDRNFANVIEHNLAVMSAGDMTAWLDQMSNRELADLAQLYTNSNALTVRSGRVLDVLAARLDVTRLRRLARFFGTNELNNAILAVAPAKFSAVVSATEVYAAPVVGAAILASPSVTLMSATKAGVVAPMQTAPTADMTLNEIYLNFRTMPVGAMSVQAALYETGAYAGKNLVVAWGVGYAFGTLITDLMQTYAPTWYYGTFVPVVGGSVSGTANWLQNFVTKTYNLMLSNQTNNLGQFESDTIPILGVPVGAEKSMGSTGGDLGMENEYEDLVSSGGRHDCIGGTCAPIDAQ